MPSCATLLWCICCYFQRLKAALSQQTYAAQGCLGVAMGSSAMVPQRVEQSQLLVQHPDAPSPAQPQVLQVFTLELLSVNIMYTTDAIVFVREQSFTLLWHYAVHISVYSALLCSGVTRSAHRRSQAEDD